jgi:hypothetical protein
MSASLTLEAAERVASRVLGAIRVAPSILAADYSRLGAQVSEVLDARARA